ncbi:MAG: Flp pilus assembly complex ATPase component TadA [Phycisphaeraceae bacterium]|nr:Flp pilus assembly complex ATPase component TadA [Phycisphaeraceae bacterium]
MARKRRKIGEILRQAGKINDQQLNEALNVAKGSRQRVGEALVELKYCSETDVAQALAYQFEMDYVDPEKQDVVDKQAFELLPLDFVKKFLVLPIKKEGNKLKVAIHDPNDLETLDNLRFRVSMEIVTVVAARGKIKAYLDGMLSETRASIDQAVRAMSMDMSDEEAAAQLGATMDVSIDMDAAEGDDQAPVIRLAGQIINEAVNSGASDIHIEPFADRVRLRYRIDGVCQERDRLPKRVQAALTARMKIMSGMKIEEKRIPQDGRIKKKVGEQTIDFRVSACPTYHGESIVLRILRPESARIGLVNLGMREDTKQLFETIIRRPNGIFLVTGPTGSGKTTTLYTALDVLNRPDKKIITAEDPVEFSFKGINQCQVNTQIGLTFANILRAMLRQAPNIILVGEIRDKEVGEVAIQAALTGHLVFSTLHTNDAPSAITRLVDMGIKPFLVASSIQAILAQRLVRLLCPKCKQPETEPNHRLMRLCNITKEDLQEKVIYKAVGCAHCRKTGYKGRQGIYELMILNHEIRELAFNRAPLNKIRQAAINTGMRNLLGDGRLKILDGMTTMEELATITQAEGVVAMEEEEENAVA